MTEEEFGKFIKKIVILIVIAVIILVVIGFIVFNQIGKKTSIFESQAEIDNYRSKVQELNSREVEEKIQETE